MKNTGIETIKEDENELIHLRRPDHHGCGRRHRPLRGIFRRQRPIAVHPAPHGERDRDGNARHRGDRPPAGRPGQAPRVRRPGDDRLMRMPRLSARYRGTVRRHMPPTAWTAGKATGRPGARRANTSTSATRDGETPTTPSHTSKRNSPTETKTPRPAHIGPDTREKNETRSR